MKGGITPSKLKKYASEHQLPQIMRDLKAGGIGNQSLIDLFQQNDTSSDCQEFAQNVIYAGRNSAIDEICLDLQKSLK